MEGTEAGGEYGQKYIQCVWYIYICNDTSI